MLNKRNRKNAFPHLKTSCFTLRLSLWKCYNLIKHSTRISEIQMKGKTRRCFKTTNNFEMDRIWYQTSTNEFSTSLDISLFFNSSGPKLLPCGTPCGHYKFKNNRSLLYSLGENQINALRKLRAYVQNTTLVGKDQSLIRRQCLEYWQVCCSHDLKQGLWKLDQ